MNRFERQIVKLVLSKLPSNSLIVDVPCGLGRFSDIIIQLGHRYVGMDVNFEGARYASERLDKSLPTMQASIFSLPLANNSADFVISVRMMHHFQSVEIEQALKEFSRIAPQGLVTFYNRRAWRIQRRRFSWRIRRREWRGGVPWNNKARSIREMERLATRASFRIKEKFPSFRFTSFTSNHFLWLERIKAPEV